MKRPCRTCRRTDSASSVRQWRTTSSVWSKARSTTPGCFAWLRSGWKTQASKWLMTQWRSVCFAQSQLVLSRWEWPPGKAEGQLCSFCFTEECEANSFLQVSATHVSAGRSDGNQDVHQRLWGHWLPRCPKWCNSCLHSLTVHGLMDDKSTNSFYFTIFNFSVCLSSVHLFCVSLVIFSRSWFAERLWITLTTHYSSSSPWWTPTKTRIFAGHECLRILHGRHRSWTWWDFLIK